MKQRRSYPFLRGLQLGNRYTITLRGVVVAELIPPSISKHHVAEAVADMQRFILSHDAMEGIDTKALIEDGRD